MKKVEAIKKYLEYKGYRVDVIFETNKKELHVLVHPYPESDVRRTIRRHFSFSDIWLWQENEWEKIKLVWLKSSYVNEIIITKHII
jgi:hypothetical protein